MLHLFKINHYPLFCGKKQNVHDPSFHESFPYYPADIPSLHYDLKSLEDPITKDIIINTKINTLINSLNHKSSNGIQNSSNKTYSTIINNNSSISESNLEDKDYTYLEEKIVWKDTIPFIPNIVKCQVIKVYDGDTITVACKLPFSKAINQPNLNSSSTESELLNTIYRFSVRLSGIDCPEMKTHNEDEKNIAKKAQQTLEEMLLHKIVYLKNISTEKYGRLLADVYYDEIHINQMMLDNRYAVKYNGGTKISPSSWTKYHEIGEL